jgi:hypothetical protein
MVNMKRFIFLSVLFLFIGTISHAQMVKPNKVQVEKKSTTTVAVDKNGSIQTNKGKLPTKRAVKTRISMQATNYKKRNK